MFFVLSFIACCSFIHCSENSLPPGIPVDAIANTNIGGFLATYNNGEKIAIQKVTDDYFRVARHIEGQITDAWEMHDDRLWQCIAGVFRGVSSENSQCIGR